MTLYEEPVGKLDYNLSTGLLEASHRDLHSDLIPGIKHAITTIMCAVRTLGVKKLMLDSSHAVTKMKEEENRYAFSYLFTSMTMTGLRKVAWVRSVSTEEGNLDYISRVQPFSFTFQLREFTRRADALEWLNRADQL